MTIFRLSFLLMALSAAGLGCGGEDSGSGSDSAFPPIESEEDFNEATSEEGDAEGNEFSGSYSITTGGLAYSDDCTVEFVLAYDFAIDSSLSEAEVEAIIDDGQDPVTFTQDVEQRDGILVFFDAGDDDEDIQGPVNSDGSFRVIDGAYIDDDNFELLVWEGTIDGNFVSGTYTTTLHIENLGVTGSCTASTTFSGQKTSSSVSEAGLENGEMNENPGIAPHESAVDDSSCDL